MPESVDVRVADLLLDQENARMRDEQDSQQAAALAIAKQQGTRLVILAEDIVKNGLDPSSLPCVVATGGQKKGYVVLEGNRRVLALKALDTPSLVTPVLDSSAQRRLTRAAEAFAKSPIGTIQCVLFESEEAVRHWIELRHTGANEGAGLIEWGADEKDRFRARHGKGRSPAGQVLDFVEKRGMLTDEARRSRTGISTSLARLLNTPEVREALGIDKIDGDVYSRFPADEVAKGLTHIVDDLKTGRVRVGDIYHAPERLKYAANFPKSALPNARTQLKEAVSLSDLATGAAQPRRPPSRSRRRKPVRPRINLIPRECRLNVDPPRINQIYIELSGINLDQFPNACSVAMRVFLELSIDHYLAEKGLMTDVQRRNTILAKRLKVVAADMRKKRMIDTSLEAAVKKVADGAASSIAASTATFNQYVHNRYVFPNPSELRTAWDEIQPLMEKLWP